MPIRKNKTARREAARTDIYFNIEEACGYAAARFDAMYGERGGSGADESRAAYERAARHIKLRAAVSVRDGSVTDGGISIGGDFIKFAPASGAEGVEKIYVYALTAGGLSPSGGTLMDTLEDMWGTAFTDACRELLREKIKKDNPGRFVSHAFGPGFYGIKTEDIKTLFNMLDCSGVGITMENCLLSPMKSSIGFFLVSGEEIRLPSRDCENCGGDTACEFCASGARRVKITFANEGVSIDAAEGETILSAARRAGIYAETPCGGHGRCGKCVCVIEREGKRGRVKMCTERVYEDAVVYTRPGRAGITVEKVRGGKGKYFLAVDIGTTTIAAELFNENGTAARASALNPQAEYAADVIGRIKLASEGDDMNKLISGAINLITERLCAATGISAEDISKCVLSGNTVMQYIASGKNPAGLGQYPYTVHERFGREISAAECGLKLPGSVYFPPVISAFVGGDIVCGIMRERLWEHENTLFIDIGTNGEMAVFKNKRLFAASAAAGPAFEGAGIAFGMRAEAGAVARFSVVNRSTVAVETVGRAAARGICGSGLLDAVGELVKCGIITADGSFCGRMMITSPLRNRLCEYNGETAFKICSGVYLTQSDVRSFQLAKAALRAGTELMADGADSVTVSGAFGAHAREESLINAGILPEKFRGAVRTAGNTSLEGAKALLADERLRGYAAEAAANARTVPFSANEEFERLFIKHMNFGSD